jgi:hypothetical protein
MFRDRFFAQLKPALLATMPIAIVAACWQVQARWTIDDSPESTFAWQFAVEFVGYFVSRMLLAALFSIGLASLLAWFETRHSRYPNSKVFHKSQRFIRVMVFAPLAAVLTIAALWIVWMLLFAISSQPRFADVDQSTEPIAARDAPAISLSGSFPASATDIHYARSSAGMGGRFLAYRFTAPLTDLNAHALKEFAAFVMSD